MTAGEMNMPDDLRTRIAAVLADEFKRQGYACEWAVLADAVIAELGLHREELSEVGSSVLFDDPRPHHRYVTEWTADE